MHTPPSSTSVCVGFGGRAAVPGALMLPIPVLAGDSDEVIFEGMTELGVQAGFRMFERDGLRVGIISEPAEADIEGQTHRLYRRLPGLIEGRRLVRMWNYVPRINEPDTEGLENYRGFCRGRSRAFEENLGEDYRDHLPAASAVGGADDRLALVFAATRARPRHVENPDQVPAYEYPAEHGPRAPSFARATCVDEAGSRYVFISGTAAIKGHATMAAGDLGGQIACTLDNLRIISRGCGLDGLAGSGAEWRRHFKVYLKHAEDYAAARSALEGVLFSQTDRVTWLRSDICRAALLIEIEATLVASA